MEHRTEGKVLHLVTLQKWIGGSTIYLVKIQYLSLVVNFLPLALKVQESDILILLRA